MKTVILTILLFQAQAFAKIRLQDVRNMSKGSALSFVLPFSGELSGDVTVDARKDFIQISLNEAEVWPKIEKRFDTQGPYRALAYQFNKDTVRLRLFFKRTFEGDISKNVSAQILENAVKVDINLPAVPVIATDRKNRQKNIFSETKTKNLPKGTWIDSEENSEGKISSFLEKDLDEKQSLNTDDRKETSFLEVKKNEKSFIHELGRVVGITVLAIGLFIGAFFVIRKTFFKKSGLSLLNNYKGVQVLSTSPLGQKKFLHLVKVGEQTILVGATDQNISLLTEIKDSTSEEKKIELEASGKNFDTQFEKVDTARAPKEFSLKPSDKLHLPQENVSFSEKLKSKVSELRPMGS